MAFDPSTVLFFTLAAVGLNYVVVYGEIFGWLRLWLANHFETGFSIVSCPQCLGFWTGLGVFALLQAIGMPGFFVMSPTAPALFLCCMLAFAFVVSLISTLCRRLVA